MTSRRACSLAAIAVFTASFAFPYANSAGAQSLAATPPMGWNSWNHFHRNVDDKIIRAQADAMVSSGMRDAGYIYVNIDDTWQGERDAQGNIQPNSKFPDMKALADYVHSKGLKIGIYSSPGDKTCAGYAGSLGHEEQDAATYAAWGMDYLKYDLCGLRTQLKAAPTPEAAHKIMVDAYIKMRDALRKTGRPIVYSLCQYGDDAVWRWGTDVGGNLWRTTGDINDHYARMAEIGFSQAGLARFAGPGHWNDPDMLEVGNGGMNEEEYRTAHEPVGDSRRALARRQRSVHDDARNHGDAYQPRSHCHRSGLPRQAGRSSHRRRTPRDMGQAPRRWIESGRGLQPPARRAFHDR